MHPMYADTMGRSVLVCDAGVLTSSQLAQELDALGHVATVCKSLDAALDRLQSDEQYQLVLLSDRLPGGEDFKGLKAVRELFEHKLVVLMISETDDKLVFDAYRQGADMVLMTPLELGSMPDLFE